MEIAEIKDLMAQFDASDLREFSYKTGEESLSFSKNETSVVNLTETVTPLPVTSTEAPVPNATDAAVAEVATSTAPLVAEGDEVTSPLVGVAYLSPAPDKPAFVSIGDSVKKGQTLMIIEAMKVMNEIPAPQDGVVTEILVQNEDVVEFGQGLVRIK